MKNRIIILLALLAVSISLYADSIPSSFSRPLLWRIGVGVNPAYVPATNSFLEGYNLQDRRIRSSISTSLQADFSFDANTREGLLYRDLYQGVAVGVNSFYSGSVIGCGSVTNGSLARLSAGDTMTGIRMIRMWPWARRQALIWALRLSSITISLRAGILLSELPAIIFLTAILRGPTPVSIRLGHR